MPEEKISLLLILKDGVSKVFNKIKGAGNKFASGMKSIMGTVKDAFKSSMFSAVALGTAVSQFAFKAIASIKQWATEAKLQFQTFEKSLAAVYTLLDKDTFNKHAKDLEDGAIKIMQDYNLSIEDVNKALFDTVSAGVNAADATDFLASAAKLAKGGVTDLSTAVDGITSIMNAYGLETNEASNIADAFFTAQKFGKTTVEEMSRSVGKVVPIAKAAGMSYQEVFAALSQMTLAGISTDEAVTALKGTLTAIIKPTSEAASLFDALGIPMGSAAFEGENFGKTMEKIKTATGGNIDEIAKLIPNVRALLNVTSVATKEGLQKYDDILKEIKIDHESLTQALKKQMAVQSELIATEKGKLLPHKLKLGKLLSKIELGWLKLANATLKVKNIYVASMGVYGQVLGYLSSMANKIVEITGLRKKEHDQEKTINEEKKTIIDEQIEKEAEANESKHELDQEFLDRKAEMELIAEEARREFEQQKKNFDNLSAEERIKLLTDLLGKEKIIKTTQQIQELLEKGLHEKALAKQNKLYHAAFIKLNSETIENLDNSWKKHWTFLLAGQKLNAKERKTVDSAMATAFSDIMYLMGKESIAAFRIMQGVAIAETLLKTYESAQLAFTALAGIPIVGPVLGGIAAGVAITAGLARAESIRQQRPPALEKGGRVVRGGLAELHDAEVILNKTEAQNIGSPQIINIIWDDETIATFVSAFESKKEQYIEEGKI